ncbi:uncharacterized protein LOC112171646 [Rosa chinensis]|nr:uncharacterized protein LOC112171646 [Rosa chinensis]
MLVSTLDMLTQAASNSLYVFCFCNLIIVMIVVGSKPGSYFDQESELPRSKVTYTITSDKQVDHDANCEQMGITSSSVVINSEVSNAKKELASDEKAGFDEQIVVSNECDNDDELRRRAEEFIKKVNREWRAELLTNSHLIEAYLVLSVSTTMLDTTLDLLTQATSNSLIIFCFCNLIIAIILLGSKSISNDHVESSIHLRRSTNKHEEDEQGTSAKQVSEERLESNASMQVSQPPKANHAVPDNIIVSKIIYGNGNDETEAEDEELRTRVEEFIQKVNQAWKAEFLRTTCIF